MGGSYFNTSNGQARRGRSSRPSRASSSEPEGSLVDAELQGQNLEGGRRRRQASQMNLVREQRSWGYFCSSSSRRQVARGDEDDESQKECFAQAKSLGRRRRGGWQNWCSEMYFNCTHVNRETITSEYLEDMEAGAKKSLAQSLGPGSPNFGEEGKDIRR